MLQDEPGLKTRAFYCTQISLKDLRKLFLNIKRGEITGRGSDLPAKQCALSVRKGWVSGTHFSAKEGSVHGCTTRLEILRGHYARVRILYLPQNEI